MAGLLNNRIGYGAYPGGVAGGYGGILGGGYGQGMSTLADALTGIGVGLLSQQPSTAGPVSPFAGIGQGLQYANQLGQQRRSAQQQQFQNQLLQRQADMEAEKFGFEKQQMEDQKKQAADQHAAVMQWVQTQPPDKQALYQAFPDQAVKAYFDEQANAQKPPATRQIHRNGMIVDQQYDPKTGQFTDVGSGPQFAPQQAPQMPADVQEYQFAVNQGYKGTFQDWIAENHKRDSGLGMQGYWGVDKVTGKPVLFQLSPSGTAQQTKLPDNIDPTKPLIPVNTGTGTAMTDPITGVSQNVIPKDVAGQKTQETVGTATGNAQVNLPLVQNSADLIIKTIEMLKNHPGREAATGMSSILNPVAIPGSDRKDFLIAQQQLKGQTFLNAYDQLRGGGQITEVEGAKAEAAKVRLDAAQSEGEYLKALNEFEDAVKDLATIAQRKAQGNYQPITPTNSSVPPPPPGFTVVQ